MYCITISALDAYSHLCIASQLQVLSDPVNTIMNNYYTMSQWWIKHHGESIKLGSMPCQIVSAMFRKNHNYIVSIPREI